MAGQREADVHEEGELLDARLKDKPDGAGHDVLLAEERCVVSKGDGHTPPETVGDKLVLLVALGPLLPDTRVVTRVDLLRDGGVVVLQDQQDALEQPGTVSIWARVIERGTKAFRITDAMTAARTGVSFK